MNKPVVFVIVGATIGAIVGYVLSKRKTPEDSAAQDAFENLNFKVNTAIIEPSSFPSLNKVRDVLIENPNWNLALIGHTDSSGNETKNIVLSRNRSAAVKTYLVNAGVSANRITSSGVGSQKPIADNSTPEGKEKNRRVEFVISKIS